MGVISVKIRQRRQWGSTLNDSRTAGMVISHGFDPNKELFGYQLPFAFPLYVHLVAPPLHDHSPARLAEHQAEFMATATAIARQITAVDPTYEGEVLLRPYTHESEQRWASGYWLLAAFIRRRPSPFDPAESELVATLYFERTLLERIADEDAAAIARLLERIREALREMRVTADIQDLSNPAIRIAPDAPDRLLPDEDIRMSYVMLHNCAVAGPDPLSPEVISERNDLARWLNATLVANNCSVEYCAVTRYVGFPGDSSSIFEASEHDKKRAYLILAMATLDEDEPALRTQHLRTMNEIALRKERARAYCHGHPGVTLNLQPFVNRRPRFGFTEAGWSCS